MTKVMRKSKASERKAIEGQKDVLKNIRKCMGKIEESYEMRRNEESNLKMKGKRAFLRKSEERYEEKRGK